MRHDEKLVELFLRGYNETTGGTYEIEHRPEQVERQKPAVEAVAHDKTGNRLAIEHTLLQPFVGERDDSQRFLAAIAPLEAEESLVIPNFDITLMVFVGAIPKGVPWGNVYETVRDWLRGNVHSFPIGFSSHRVPDMPFDLSISIEKTHLPDSPGCFFVARHAPPDSLDEVMRTAFSRKLSKLVETPADRRILLLEKADILHGYGRTRKSIETVGPEFRDFARVNEVWLANTVAWAREKVVFFYELWPYFRRVRFEATD